MTKYVSKAPKGTAKVPSKTISADEAGKLGNYECRKVVFRYLADQKMKPDSTKDADMVPELVDLVGEPPDDLDEEADVYVWAVLRLVDQGKLKLPSLAFKAWGMQSRVKLVKAFMATVKTNCSEDE